MSDDSGFPPNSLRLCHIFKWVHFDGYGFNLHAEKGKPGQYIGKVDEGSPAEAAGLKQGDRIVEVNGVNISNENHKQVVQRIKAIRGETKLLVVDPEGDAYFKAQGIILKSGLPYVVHMTTPPTMNESKKCSDDDDIELKEDLSSSNLMTENPEDTNGSPVIIPRDDSENGSDKVNFNQEGLNLSMTAKELRAQLAARKKFDPKKQTVDIKQKYDIVQKL